MRAGWGFGCRVVSAPGKVLITGAYLVLEQPHAGLVVSTSARFFAIVKPIHQGLAPDSWSWVSSFPSFVQLHFCDGDLGHSTKLV